MDSKKVLQISLFAAFTQYNNIVVLRQNLNVSNFKKSYYDPTRTVNTRNYCKRSKKKKNRNVKNSALRLTCSYNAIMLCAYKMYVQRRQNVTLTCFFHSENIPIIFTAARRLVSYYLNRSYLTVLRRNFIRIRYVSVLRIIFHAALRGDFFFWSPFFHARVTDLFKHSKLQKTRTCIEHTTFSGFVRAATSTKQNHRLF